MWPLKRSKHEPPKATENDHASRRHRRLKIDGQPFIIHSVLPWQGDDDPPEILSYFLGERDKSGLVSYVLDRRGVDVDQAKTIHHGLCYPSIPIADIMADEARGRPLFFYILAFSLNAVRGAQEADFERTLYDVIKMTFSAIYSVHNQISLGGEERP